MARRYQLAAHPRKILALTMKATAALPDEELNYSDIPPMANSFWKKTVQNPYYKPTTATVQQFKINLFP